MNTKQEKKRCTAILLSAGSGNRMKSDVAKQYMPLGGKPVIWYSLNVLERSAIIDDCILVAGAEDIEYVRREIVEQYGFTKVDSVIAGGAERSLSVLNAIGLLAGDDMKIPNRDGYIFIHDGARPFLTEDILRRTYEDVRRYRACVAAMPSKDTVKITDEEGFAVNTPDRRRVWNIQTPQVFEVALITEAYTQYGESLDKLARDGVSVTDDAGIVELFTDCRVKMTEGSYENMKLTTPEDFGVAETFLRMRCLEK